MGVVLGLILALLATFRGVLPGLGGNSAPAADVELLLPEPFPAPALNLSDPQGRSWTLASLRGSVVALFFGYTNCPDVCPITLGRLGRLQGAMGGAGPALEIVFVTVDPARDTPERLRAFVEALPGHVRAVTGSEAEVRAQAGEFGVMVLEREVEGLPEGEYLVDHTARTFLLDPAGRVVATLAPMASPDEIRGALDAVYRSLR